jgi:hypothetical protein
MIAKRIKKTGKLSSPLFDPVAYIPSSGCKFVWINLSEKYDRKNARTFPGAWQPDERHRRQ